MRLYLGGYGHHPSGKMYAYWGSNDYRTGQNVVAPVTNKWSHKTYNTMFTIMRTSASDGQIASSEAERLAQRGIGIKFIHGSNVFEQDNNGIPLLPGSLNYTSKADWQRQSDEKYQQAIRERLMSRSSFTNNSATKRRLLGE